jgi:fructokinase
MSYKNGFKVRKPLSVCIGTGLIALDVVINGNPKSIPKLWAGGSCGNVLTILSYLGWKSYPIGRLKNDFAANTITKDLKKWKVSPSFISKDSSGSTPVIIERLHITKDGCPRHRFEWVCPRCGSRLPRYMPVLAKNVEQISKTMPKAQVFYFDRVTRSSIELAKSSKEQGALIVFEPSGVKDKKMFLECLRIADIVKYPHWKGKSYQEIMQGINIPLNIETLGSEGLRYEIGNNNKQNRKWKIMPAYPVEILKDTTGAGDWCSAGIIHLLGASWEKGLKNASEKDIITALSFGQALAALNCYYEGARGSMYKITKQKFNSLVQNIWNGISPLKSVEGKESNQNLKLFEHICPHCSKNGKGT